MTHGRIHEAWPLVALALAGRSVKPGEYRVYRGSADPNRSEDTSSFFARSTRSRCSPPTRTRTSSSSPA